MADPVSDVTILILSCDRYSDTWEPVAHSFAQNWPDCPYPVYLLTNHKHFDNGTIKSIAVGDDRDWSSNLLKMLEQVTTKRVFLWMDDVFIGERVDTAAFQRIVSWAEREDAAFIRMRPIPAPEHWRPDGLGELGPEASYRVSVFATLWKRETLNRVARAGETPWQFELDGTDRARALTGFYATRRAVFSHIHGIEKGLWLREAVTWLGRAGIGVDFGYRRQMTRREHILYQVRQAKGLVMGFVPERRRKLVLRVADVVYRAVGLRRSPAA